MLSTVKIIGKIELPEEKNNSTCSFCKSRFYSSDDLDLCYICNEEIETNILKQFHFEVWGIFEEDIERELDPVMYECLEAGTMEALDENEVKLALILKYPAEVRFKRNITIDIFEM